MTQTKKLLDDHRPKAVDLFSGCGGFTLGISKDYNVVGHVEYDDMALETYEYNKFGGEGGSDHAWPNSELIGKDITKITDEEILAFKKKHGEIGLLVGGPPCQSFSLSGQRVVGDARDNLFLHYARFVKLLQPSYFILENVPGLLSKKNADGDLMIDIIREHFKNLGYRTELSLCNAANYGVPQNRRRVFLYGTPKDSGLPIVFPLPLNFGEDEGTKDCKLPFCPACSICGNHYGSYTFNERKEKVCMYCYYHREIDTPLAKSLEIEPNFLMLPKNAPIPAGPEDFLMVRCIIQRSSLKGISRFLYCDDAYGNTSYLLESEARRVADHDIECDHAEAFITAMLFANSINMHCLEDEDDE